MLRDRPYKLLRNNSMHAFADKDNIRDLHITQVRFGGDVFLQPGTKRFAEPVSESSKDNCERNEQESPTGRVGSSKRRPGKSSGKKRGGRHIRAAPRMDGESTFTGFETSQRFDGGIRNLFKLQIAEQKKTGRVGMSRHGLVCILVRKDVKCGVFERVISTSFKDEGQVE